MANIQAAEKKCRKCAVVKQLDDYHRDRRSADGRRGDCKACYAKSKVADRKRQYCRKWYAKNRDLAKNYQAVHRLQNAEVISDRRRKYYEEHKPQILLQKKEKYRCQKANGQLPSKWIEKNREYLKLKQRQYYKDNAEKCRADARARNALNRDKCKERSRTYRKERKAREKAYSIQPEERSKQLVRNQTKQAILRGEIHSKSGFCFQCGVEGTKCRPTEMHHLHYDKPDSYKAIIELCRDCHIQYDCDRRKSERHNATKMPVVLQAQPDLFG